MFASAGLKFNSESVKTFEMFAQLTNYAKFHFEFNVNCATLRSPPPPHYLWFYASFNFHRKICRAAASPNIYAKFAQDFCECWQS